MAFVRINPSIMHVIGAWRCGAPVDRAFGRAINYAGAFCFSSPESSAILPLISAKYA
jgi:hypothetical protein